RRRSASHAIRWHRPAWSALPCCGTPCDRAWRRRSAGTLRCRAGSRGRSTGRMPWRGTDPSRTNSSGSDHRHSGRRTSGTLGEGGTQSVGKRLCARRSSGIVAAPGSAAKHPFNAFQHFKSFLLRNARIKLTLSYLHAHRESFPGQQWAEASFLGNLTKGERDELIRKLYKLQEGHCYISGESIDLSVHQVDLDHIIARARGGPDDESNIGLALS